MASQDLNRSIKITIDGTDAAKAVDKLEKEIADLTAKLNGLNKSEADYDKRSKELGDRISKKNKTLETYKRKVADTDRVLNNLSGATYKELLAVKSQLQKSLQSEVRGTEKYNETLRQYKRVTEEATKAQKDMRVEVGCQGTFMGKAVNTFNKYAAVVTAGIAAITGAVLKLNTLRTIRNEREDVAADVQALTGLDDTNITWLEQQAIKLSTSMQENGVRIRQSATDILEAYKLVGSAKPELLSNKEALNQVTIEALTLAQAAGLDLKNAVDAVTLSLNQYGAGADEAARYTNVMAAGSKYGAAAVESVTTAVTKSGVAASSANIPIEQLVGSIETLAEKGIKDEIAGTGLKKFFLTLQTDADDTNPKIVGLQTALENLQAKQMSAAEVKKMFGEEGFNVAQVLIQEADRVKYYTQAVTDTTIAVEQAATKSDTAAAKLAQAKNRLNELGIQFINRINPAIVSGANGLVNWANKFVSLCEFIAKNIYLFGTITTAIIGLVIAMQAEVMWAKLVTFWNEKLLVGFRKLYAVLLAHPWMALISVCALFIAHLKDMSKAISDVERQQKMLDSAIEEATSNVKKESSELETLVKIAKDKSASDDDRRKAIERLNQISPEYLGNLTLENINTTDADTAVKRYTASLLANAKAKAIQNKIDELEQQKQNLKQNPGAATRWYDPLKTGLVSIASDAERVGNTFRSLFTKGTLDGWYEQTNMEMAYATSQFEVWQTRYNNEMSRIEGDQERLTQELEQITRDSLALQIEPVVVDDDDPIIPKSPSGGEESTGKGETPTEKALREEKELHQRYLYELKQEYANQEGEILMTKEEYADAQEQLVMMHLQRSLDIVGLDAQQKMDIEQQLLDFKIKCVDEELANRKRAADEQAKIEEQNRKKLEDIGRKRYQTMMGYAETFSSGIANAIANEQNVLEAFGDSMVDIVFDVVEQLIDAELIRLTGIGLSTIAEVQARQIGSKGFAGIASGLALAAVISASLAAAKAGLKALLKGGKKSSDGGTEAKSYKRVATGVNQYASGKYDVIGGSDGRLYSGVPYIGAAPTGIVRSPALISEHGAELIINSEDLARLQQHVNYPLVLQAIADSRRGTAVPQHETGSYPVPVSPSRETTGNSVSMDTLRRLAEAIEYLNENGVAATTVLSEFEKKQALRDRARKIGSKKR